MTSVSIVIPHLNGKEMLHNCIQSLLDSISNIQFEVIVVDNGSTDNSIENIKKHFNEVKIVHSKKNLGYSGGCNLGATKAIYDYIIFLNNDTLHSKGWIEELVSFLDSNPHIGAAQPKILNAINRNKFDYAGAAGGFIDKYCFPYAQGRLFSTIEEDEGQFNEPKKIFWASGAAFIVRKDVFISLGKFDDIYFAYMEEIDFCWQMHLDGWGVWYVPSSSVYHFGKQTIKEYSFKSHYFNHRNSWILFLKNSYSFDKGLLILKRLFLDYMACIYSIISFDFNRLIAIISSHLWLIFNFYKFPAIRKNKTVKNAKIDTLFNGSIAIEYFLKRNKYFSDINQ